MTVGHDGVVPPEGVDPAVHLVVHEVKVCLVAVLVNVSGVRAPLLISLIGAQVGHHHSYGSVLNCTVARVDTVTRGSEFVARTAARTAPGRSAGVVYQLTSSSSVHSPLPAEGAFVTGAATTRTHLAVEVASRSRARKAIEHGRISGTSRMCGRSEIKCYSEE